MQDGQEFEINGTVYTLFDYEGQWFWSHAKDESDFFPTALDALQNAINTESAPNCTPRKELSETLSATWR